jgi:hypothetical protein
VDARLVAVGDVLLDLGMLLSVVDLRLVSGS